MPKDVQPGDPAPSPQLIYLTDLSIEDALAKIF